MKTLQMVNVRDKNENLLWTIPCTTKKCAIATMRDFNNRHTDLHAEYKDNILHVAYLINEKIIEHYETL